MKNLALTCFIAISMGLATPVVEAREPILGIHILDTSEVMGANDFAGGESEEWSYVTVPIRSDQLDKQTWQNFFDRANDLRLVPIVRLMTDFDPEVNAWREPEKRDIVEMAEFLSELEWHTSPRRVIVYNEPNHAAEWGGRLDPEGYAEILEFAADWFHTENANYKVLPAGLDAAAPNGPVTMESFSYLSKMVAHSPTLITKIDAWTSHSYPNPGFSASAYADGKQSISGWKDELAYIERNWGRNLEVYITETGWDQDRFSLERLSDYYEHALSSAWNDPRVLAVTPFVLNGNNGIFEKFSFTAADGSPSKQHKALLAAREKIEARL